MKYRSARSAAGVSGCFGTSLQSMSERSTFPDDSMRRSILNDPDIRAFLALGVTTVYGREGCSAPWFRREFEHDRCVDFFTRGLTDVGRAVALRAPHVPVAPELAPPSSRPSRRHP